MSIISKNLETLLRNYNLSIQKLSLISGIDNHVIKAIIEECYDPKLSVIVQICQALEIPFEALLGDPEDYKDYRDKISQNYLIKKISLHKKEKLFLFEEDKYPYL